MDGKSLKIILAEDDDGHATLIRRNLQRARLNAEIVRMRSGEEVLEYLDRELSTPDRGGRMLLLLDIRMHGMDGIEVLQRLKSDDRMRLLPVYMLTTTDNPSEVDRCFELGCNAYLTKPVSYEEFSGTMEKLCGFLEVSQVPFAPAGASDGQS